MSDTVQAANVRDSRVRLAEIENNVRWLKGIGAFGAAAVIAALAWLNVQVYETRAEVYGLKVEVSGLKAEVSGLKAEISGLKAEVSGLKADIADIKAGFELIEAHFNKQK
ncbi:MAG: hypothetical protein OXD29_10000 [Roseovarius sp.]|nr:hypothetical protein [Roseovarius sp.]